LFRVVNRYVGNLAPMPGVFPDYPSPVVRNAGTERELVLMRWACRHRPERAATRYQYPQHVIAALAYVAQAGKSLFWSRSTASLSMRRSRPPRPRKKTSSSLR
jgi:hypothetical protein